MIKRNRGYRRKISMAAFICASLALILFVTCGKPQQRLYYMLNYTPPQMQQRSMQNPYSAVIRLREFSIEEAYNRFQIVYRTSPFEFRYYNFRSWAVRPTRMMTDLFFKHLNSVRLVSSVVRRLDEGRRPDFELTGFIEAIEEYDSEDVIFAHIAMRVSLTRLSDGETIYNRHFDLRRRVHNKGMEFVVREMSQIVEFIFTEAIADIDVRLAQEFGIAQPESPEFMLIEQPSFFAEEVTPEFEPVAPAPEPEIFE
jgi:ABC-type uncharacterized transport system auxiliary subunit